MAPTDGEPTAAALARLTSVSRALTYAVSIEEVLEITVECAEGLLEAPRVVLMLRGEDDLLRIRASRGVEPSVVERFREPLDETLLNRLSGVLGPEAREGFLGVPLVVRGAVRGLLAVLRSRGRALTERDEWLLSALADQAAVALDNARAEASRSELEAEVRALRKLGTQREDALRMVGHDLRSPLSALQGYVHLLEIETYGPITPGQRTALARLATIGRHLEALVSNVLEMGRLTAGTLNLEVQAVELGPVVQGAHAMIELAAADRSVTVVTDVPPGLSVMADADRLRQVLIQLLENAVKYSPEGTDVRLEARGEDVPGEPARTVVRVIDQGRGIPAEDAETIFEPYRQLEEGVVAGGIGLGLAIARGLVERMGGTLALEPGGPGATFALRLRAP